MLKPLHPPTSRTDRSYRYTHRLLVLQPENASQRPGLWGVLHLSAAGTLGVKAKSPCRRREELARELCVY